MMNKIFYSLLILLFFVIGSCKNEAEEPQTSNIEVTENESAVTKSETPQEPWTRDQLLEPRDLAQILQNSEDSLVIISLGAGGIIPGSKDTGPSGEKQSLDDLRTELESLPKDSDIVIYCGCCPFDICPNVRPAFGLLNEMQFTNHQLLNLRENIKVDWIDKGYPVGS